MLIRLRPVAEPSGIERAEQVIEQELRSLVPIQGRAF